MNPLVAEMVPGFELEAKLILLQHIQGLRNCEVDILGRLLQRASFQHHSSMPRVSPLPPGMMLLMTLGPTEISRT